MRIGIDFDNTIASYDAAFLAAARNQGLIEESFTGGKAAVRDAMRSLQDGERKWQTLQGRVYGAFMEQAALIPGVAEFLTKCNRALLDVFIVSHKTEFGHFDPEKVNLRDAAMAWMHKQGFFDPDRFNLSPLNIYFESTRAEKLARIGALELDLFIDDLPEVLSDPDFPDGPQKVLYDPDDIGAELPYDRIAHWNVLTQGVFDGAA